MSDAIGRRPPEAQAARDVAKRPPSSGSTVSRGLRRRMRQSPISPAPTEPPFQSPPIVCPFLVADDLRWRGSKPAREHRCSAVVPHAQLALDKQRRLCLTDGYRECATYLAARAARSVRGPLLEAELRRPIVRTTPIVIDRARQPLPLGSLDGRGRVSQVALGALMLLALAVVVYARLPGDSSPAQRSPGSAATPTFAAIQSVVTPAATETAVPSTSPTPPPTPTRSPAPTASTPAPTASTIPSPTPEWHHLYTVKPGDTLSSIAASHDTTVSVIQTLNGITNPRLIYSGQVLRLP